MSHIKIKPPVPKQDLNHTINYLFVVAALVVGAAFAGVLQIPDDGSTDNGGNVPTASRDFSQLQKKSFLSLFLFSNILTMNLAGIAAVGLFLALLLDANLASILVSVSFLLLELSLTYMGSSFLYAILLRMRFFVEADQLFLVIVLYVFLFIQRALVIITVLFFTLGREVSALANHLLHSLLFLFSSIQAMEYHLFYSPENLYKGCNLGFIRPFCYRFCILRLISSLDVCY